MSAEPQGDLAGLARPVALAATLEPLSRLVAFSRAIASERVEQRMLRVASRELTLMLNGEACLVSRLEEGLLREVADYSSSDRQVARGLSYYLADYPSTAAVLESGVPCSISADDKGADPAELFVLREMEMQSVLIVPLTIETRTWGLIEIYDSRTRVFSGVERYLAELAVTHIGALLSGFEHEERAQRLYRETLASLSNALEAKDAVTSQHTEEVVRLAVAVAAELDLDLDAVRNVELGAVLPEVGAHILRPIQSLNGILPLVRHHHERWDGGGYPDKLTGRAIPLGARIVAVCDAYRAMTEDRPYRSALSSDEARKELHEGSGSQFDPDCVEAMIRALDRRDSAATVVALR